MQRSKSAAGRGGSGSGSRAAPGSRPGSDAGRASRRSRRAPAAEADALAEALAATPAAEGEGDGRKAETQAQILEAAVELFATRGYERTTIAAIASSASVSRAAVFWHFGDKATLFQEAFRRLLVPFVSEIARELEPLPPRKRVFELFNAYEDFTQRNQATVERFVGWALESPALRAALAQPLMALHEAFVREVAESIAEVVPDPSEAAALAAGFLSLLDGNLLLSLIQPDPRAAERRRQGLRLLARQVFGADGSGF